MKPGNRAAEELRRLCPYLLRYALVVVGSCVVAAQAALPTVEPPRALYTNIVDSRGPWSVHVVKVPRKGPYELRSIHASGRAIGLSELTDQVRSVFSRKLEAVAAVNGDFYQREGSHAGDPRGLQIIDGELISAPAGSASFWLDVIGEPQVANTTSEFAVTWPDGSSTPFGLNGERDYEGIELYTPAVGRATRTSRGRDIILEQEGNGAWLPLRPGKAYRAKVRAVRDGANCEIAPGSAVLSVGPSLARELPAVKAGDVLTLSTSIKPDLRGAKLAISGGPVLLRNGSIPSFRSRGRGFETHSVNARHPRSAVGWNKDFYFLVEVDGRQRRSVGMALPELSDFLLQLGCTDAMNLDGGGSATIWYDGRIRNRPCDGEERAIANSLVVITKAGAESPPQTASAAK